MDGRVNTQALTYLRHRLTTSSIQYLEKGKVAPTKCVAKGMKGKVYNYSRKYPVDPSGNLTIAIETDHRNSGFSH